MHEYNICYNLDSEYVEQLAVSICSILKNSKDDDNINFYILDGGLTQEDKLNIEKLKKIKPFSIKYIKMHLEDFADCPLNPSKNKNEFEKFNIPIAAYFRLKLPSLIKNIDKILYLDCDLVVRTSLENLYVQNIENKAVFMVLDSESKKETKRLDLQKYFNAGVMLINLDYWRKENVEDKFFKYIRDSKSKILWLDQDVINAVLKDEIGELSRKWNYQYFQYEEIDLEEFANCSIVHMAGRFKPWLMPFEHPIYDLYYYYLSFTDWRKNITLYKNMASGKHLKNGIGGSVTNITVAATDEDIQKVYSEIDNSYKFIDTTREFLESQVDESKNTFYTELKKNYEFTKELNEETKYLSEVMTDDKITLVYEEITKNYEYTNNLVEEKVKLSQEENINKIEKANIQTDEKITLVYDEITKNYEYTNNLVDRVKTSQIEFENKINSEVIQTDEKIGKVYEEITKNYKYTEEIVYNSQNTINNSLSKVNDRLDILKKELNENISNSISQMEKTLAENKIELNNNFKKYTDNRLNELYSYINEEVTGTYNSVNNSYKSLESKIENTKQKIYFQISDINSKIDKINNLVFVKPDKNDISELQDKISKLELQCQINIENSQKWFENELNNQRIKYENRLIKMEQLIYSLGNKYKPKKSSFLMKLKNKLKKRKIK